MVTDELKSSLTQFVTFACSLKGDEKSEQLLLDHFFRALGHGGVREAGATLEFRVAKKPEKAKKCYQGQNPVNAGFFLTPDEAAEMIYADPRNREVLFPPRELYRILEDPGANPLREAHTSLGTAYGMAQEKSGAATDPLAFLLALNLTLAAKEKAGEPITPPGLPLAEAERSAFVTNDCVRISEPARATELERTVIDPSQQRIGA